LIPTYNQSAYVEETVCSALEQNYENLQVVVADDASTDGTREILKHLADQNPDRMRLILGETNLGITGNCNRGLSACDGELLAMQGGDDILMPTKIARQVEWFEQNADGVLCYHDCEVFDSGSGNSICNFSAISNFVEGHGPAQIIRAMRFSAAVCVMVRSSSIPTSGFDARLPMVSDWKLQIDVLSSGGRYGYVDGVLARYRRHPGNSRKSFPVQYYQDCLVTVAIVETEMLGYAKETRLARARIFGLMSIDHFVKGDRRNALPLAASSLRHGLFSWKFLPIIVFFSLPKGLREIVHKLFAERVRALNYLNA
jgi:glycosyltransferase involved in cell wall biosynthesis